MLPSIKRNNTGPPVIKNRPFFTFSLTFLAIFFVVCTDVAKSNNSSDTIPNVIKSASELDYPPFSIVQNDGTADGFSVELLKATVNAIGKDISFFVGPWHEIKRQLIDGHLDVLPLVSYSDARDKVLDFSIPYLRMHGTVFIRKDELTIHTEADLADKEVVVMKGDTAHEYAIGKNLSNKLIIKDTFEEAMKDLSNGKYDALIVQQLVGYQLIKKLKISNIVDINSFKETSLKLKDIPLSGFEQKFCFAVPEGNKELLSLLNEGLSLIIADGTFDKIYHKWFGPILPQPTVSFVIIVKYLMFYLIPILFFIAIFGIWYFKKEVIKKTQYLKDEINKKELTKQALQASEKKYRLMMESLTDPLYICSSEKRIEYLNPAMIKRLGRHATGEFCHKALHNLNKECEWCIFDQLKEHKAIDKTIVSPLDNRTYRLTNMPIYHSNNTISKMTIYKDITDYLNAVSEKEKAQDQLLQAQRLEAIGTLAGGIAHDFNNILFPIIGFTEISIEDLPESHPVQENLQDILQGAKRARDLVKQILSFSKQKNLEKEVFPLQPLIKETLKLLRSIIPSNIDIKEDLSDENIFIIANTTEIHEVIMNLCTNAYHAMEQKGGILKVSLKKEQPNIKFELPAGEYCCLIVEDTGTGISPEIIKNIFNPYFTTKKQGKGSGLGLSVIHGIVQSYKGAIDVQSDLDQGTFINVFLPTTSKREIKKIKLDNQLLHAGNEQILFVDDEEAIVKLGVRFLERYGYKVTGITSSIDALEIFKSDPNKYDLVITDMTMPIMIGTDLSKNMLKLRSDLPILICTGFSEQVDGETAKSLGIQGYINKPLLIDELASKVREILDQNKGK